MVKEEAFAAATAAAADADGCATAAGGTAAATGPPLSSLAPAVLFSSLTAFGPPI